MDVKFQTLCDHAVGSPIQYFVLSTCPKCMGTGYYNAYSVGTDGKIVTVSGINKLSQQLRKILTENKRPTGYGFDYTILSNNITPGTITAAKSEVLRCITYLKNSQQIEKRNGFNYLPTEEISSIDNLDAFIDFNDPRKLFITISVTTISGVTNDLEIGLRT